MRAIATGNRVDGILIEAAGGYLGGTAGARDFW